jgi:hypothetical protein
MPQQTQHSALQPSLPPLPDFQQWSGEIRHIFTFLQQKYSHAARILAQRGHEDPIRLLILAEDLNSHSHHLDALSTAGLPLNWIQDCAVLCSQLLAGLDQAAQAASGSYVPLIQHF